MFFLPFGYDALFKMVMDLSGSYWTADIVFYCISFILFGFYFHLSGTNPIMVMRKLKRKYVKMAKKNIPWLFRNKKRRTKIIRKLRTTKIAD